MSFLFAGYKKVCDGAGCTNEIPISADLCGDCALQAAREEAALRDYAQEGVGDFERFLQRWAEFEARYGPN